MILRSVCVLLAVAAAPALAQETIPVRFEPGQSGATVSNTIVGNDYIDFVLGARAGQLLTASLEVDGTNGDGTIYFNVLPPGSDGEAIWIGNMEVDQTAQLTLPEDGDYRLRVYLMGNDRDTGRTVGFLLHTNIQ